MSLLTRRLFVLLTIGVTFPLLAIASGSLETKKTMDWNPVMDAIIQVESEGKRKGGEGQLLWSYADNPRTGKRLQPHTAHERLEQALHPGRQIQHQQVASYVPAHPVVLQPAEQCRTGHPSLERRSELHRGEYTALP